MCFSFHYFVLSKVWEKHLWFPLFLSNTDAWIVLGLYIESIPNGRDGKVADKHNKTLFPLNCICIYSCFLNIITITTMFSERLINT